MTTEQGAKLRPTKCLNHKLPTSDKHYSFLTWTESNMTEQRLADGNGLQGYWPNHVSPPACVSMCVPFRVWVIEVGHNSTGQDTRGVVVIFHPAS